MKNKIMKQNYFEELKAKMESPEGLAKIDAYKKKLEQKSQIQDKRLEIFYKKIDAKSFDEFVTKIVDKYDSDNYRNKWYKLHIEPPEPLKFFLYDFAEKFGEYDYENEFFRILGYGFSKICGQGCFINIEKINCDN